MVSERAQRMSSFIAMDVLEKANELDGVVHLEVGEPDFSTPQAVVESACDSLRAGNTGYTIAKGKLELRRAISAYYDRKYGVDVDPERIAVTPGSSPGLMLAMNALVDPGEEVVLTDPHYACYPNFVRQVGGRISTVPLRADRGFRPALADFEDAVSVDTRALLLNSPANPTGAVLTGETQADLAALCRRTDTTIVADEIYHGLSYGTTEHSIIEYTDDAFVLDGFSKRYAMTGWRLGWVVVPPGYEDAINRLAQNLLICAPNFLQDAGVTALETPAGDLERVRDTYEQRRDLLLREVETWGLDLGYTPEGAYYLLVDVSDLPGDALEVADLFLEEARVAMTPGVDFGEEAADYLRVSYANTEDNLREASRRVQDVLATLESG